MSITYNSGSACPQDLNSALKGLSAIVKQQAKVIKASLNAQIQTIEAILLSSSEIPETTAALLVNLASLLNGDIESLMSMTGVDWEDLLLKEAIANVATPVFGSILSSITSDINSQISALNPLLETYEEDLARLQSVLSAATGVANSVDNLSRCLSSSHKVGT